MITSAVILTIVFIYKKWTRVVHFFQQWYLSHLDLVVLDCWSAAVTFSTKIEEDKEQMTIWVNRGIVAKRKRDEYLKAHPYLELPDRRYGEYI